MPFHKRSRIPSFNPQPILQEIRAGRGRAREAIAGARPQIEPIRGRFREDIATTQQQVAERQRELAEAFKSQFQEGLQARGTQQFQQAQQQVLGALPEIQRQTREALAATGGLQRGAAGRALQSNVVQAQQSLSDIASGIALQSQGDLNRAIGQIFQTDVGLNLQNLGVDVDTARFLAESGRSDILQEAAQLAQVELGSSQDIANVLQQAEQARIASRLAREQQKGALIRSIIGLGGTLGGAFIGGRLAGKVK